jgi:hypothetical protein
VRIFPGPHKLPGQNDRSIHLYRLVLNTPLTDKPWALLTYCVETEEGASATSERLGAMLKPMLRRLPDGSELTWRVAAMSRFTEEGRASKPFFISWDDPAQRPDKVGMHLATASVHIWGR